MDNLLRKQILVRVSTAMKITLHELAKDDQVSEPEWIREAIIQRIESELGIVFDS